MKAKILVLLLLVGASLSALSQGYTPATDTLKWSVNSFDNVSNSEVVNQSSHFISNGNKIEWVQANGSKNYTFDVTSINGNWTNTASNGSIEFQVTIGSRSGVITFSKENSQVRISMNFVVGGNNIMPYRFHVQQVEKI